MIIGNKIDMDTNKGIVNFGISTNWNVITGGPSSGKTTIVNQLKKLGFSSTPEAARVLIDIGINNGLTIQEIRRDEEQFNQSILCIQMAMENILVPDHVCFHDRGTPDSLAYIRLSGGDESIARKFAMKRKYNKIFLLELLPFKKDYARTEDSDKAKQIEQMIYETYEELNYEVILVPVSTIEERMDFILDSLGINNLINESN